MSLTTNIISEVVKDGVKITTYKDGSQHFALIDQPKQTIVFDGRTWWQKLKDWWNNTPITPYIKIRDLADPFGDRTDIDAGQDGNIGIETGIKIKF